jgi:hypothetical protein
VGLLGLSASAVGKHVVCWVGSSLAVGFFGSPSRSLYASLLCLMAFMLVQGSLFPLILG